MLAQDLKVNSSSTESPHEYIFLATVFSHIFEMAISEDSGPDELKHTVYSSWMKQVEVESF